MSTALEASREAAAWLNKHGTESSWMLAIDAGDETLKFWAVNIGDTDFGEQIRLALNQTRAREQSDTNGGVEGHGT